MTHSSAAISCAVLWMSCAAVAHADPPSPHLPGKVNAGHAHKHAAHDMRGEAVPAQEPQAQAEPAPDPSAQTAGAAAPPSAASSNHAAPAAALPEGHTPTLSFQIEPAHQVRTGQLVHLVIAASAQVGDDVTIAEQSFAPFEVYKKQARVEPPNAGKQRFVFQLDLLALEAGDKPVPAIDLRVVTKDNFVGVVKTQAVPYKVQSLVANDPNAQPKLETKPVAVLQDNFIPLYILGGLVAAALIAGLTLLIARYLRNRKAAAVPPPPPRPPWDIAVEKLGLLRQQKAPMLAAGQGGLFIDQLSDVVRAYLGGRYAFDGLETTSDEMLMQLKAHGAPLGFTQEVGLFLGRCDLVKFAKLDPDEDEVDLLFAKAQDLVHFSEPAPANPPPPAAAPPASQTPAPRTSQGAPGGPRV
jgi:hypothetical protein